MALNSSGPISLGGSTAGQSIAVELGLSATGQISLNDSAVRNLAGVSSGAITMPTNFWGKSNSYINPARIILPLTTNTYTVTVLAYNYTAGSGTLLTTLSSFYTAGSSTVYCATVVDPSGNTYINAGGGPSSPSFNNFAYISNGSNTVSPFRFYYGQYPEYGEYYSSMAWNPSYSSCLFNISPHSAEPDSPAAQWATMSSSSVTTRGASTMYWAGGRWTGLALLRTIDSGGRPTNTTTTVGAGTIAADAGGAQFAASGSSLPTQVGAVLSGAGGAFSAASIDSSNAVTVLGNGVWSYPGRTNLASIGTLGVWTGAASLANGAWAACRSYVSTSGITRLNVFSNMSTSPTWTTDLSSFVSGHNIVYMIGGGDTLYVVAVNESSRTLFMWQFVFNLSTGSYTSTSRSLGYQTANIGGAAELSNYVYY